MKGARLIKGAVTPSEGAADNKSGGVRGRGGGCLSEWGSQVFLCVLGVGMVRKEFWGWRIDGVWVRYYVGMGEYKREAVEGVAITVIGRKRAGFWSVVSRASRQWWYV